VIAIDIKNPRRENWREIVPQSSDRLVSVNMVNNQIVTEYLKDAQSQVKIYGTDGKFVRDVQLPGIGSVGSRAVARKSAPRRTASAAWRRSS